MHGVHAVTLPPISSTPILSCLISAVDQLACIGCSHATVASSSVVYVQLYMSVVIAYIRMTTYQSDVSLAL